MEGGFTRSFRAKWQHPVFRNLRDAGIWSWLTDSAVWKDTKTRFGGHVIELKRGQLITSERFIAEGFCVDRQVIRRLLDALESEQMITRKKTHGGTVITICNYDRYQSPTDWQNPEESPAETHDEPTTNPNKKELKELNEFKFIGEKVRLKAKDYDKIKATYHTITDLDAELQRIEASDLPAKWKPVVLAKLNFKHQALLKTANESAPAISKPADPQAQLKADAWKVNSRMTNLAKVSDDTIIKLIQMGLTDEKRARAYGWVPQSEYVPLASSNARVA